MSAHHKVLFWLALALSLSLLASFVCLPALLATFATSLSELSPLHWMYWKADTWKKRWKWTKKKTLLLLYLWPESKELARANIGRNPPGKAQLWFLLSTFNLLRRLVLPARARDHPWTDLPPRGKVRAPETQKSPTITFRSGARTWWAAPWWGWRRPPLSASPWRRCTLWPVAASPLMPSRSCS